MTIEPKRLSADELRRIFIERQRVHDATLGRSCTCIDCQDRRALSGHIAALEGELREGAKHLRLVAAGYKLHPDCYDGPCANINMFLSTHKE